MRRRLAVAICGTLFVGIAAFGVVAWTEVRRAAVVAAEARLVSATRQTADLLANSLTAQRNQVGSLGRDASIRAVAYGSEGPALDSAIARIGRADSLSSPILAIQIWDNIGLVAFTSSLLPETLTDLERQNLVATLQRTDTAATGPLVIVGDTVLYPSYGPIRSLGRVTAYAAVWRRLTSDSASRRFLTEIIGSQARLSVGDESRNVWTDLNAITTAPPGSPTDSLFLGNRVDGTRVLGSRAAITGTPWVVAVEFPYAVVLEPTRALARVLALAALAVLLFGITIAAAIGRSLARPIGELVAATEGLRAGDFTRRAPAGRRDEIGELAFAFNTMADAIAEGRLVMQEHAADLERQSRQTAEANAQLRLAVSAAEEARASLEVAMHDNARTLAELDAVLSSAPLGFAIHDREFRYVRVNGRMATFMGRPSEEMIGKRPRDLVPGMGQDIEEGLARALQTDRPVLDLELTGPTPPRGEQARELLATVFPVRTRESELVGVGSVLMDISAYKGLERQFLQAQRMDAVGRLAGGVAHDFNNVLTAIASFTEFAIKALPPKHEAVEDLEQVRQAVNRAAGLIRQLLAFSRQQVLQPVVLNLSDVVRNLVPMLRRLIPESVALHSFLDSQIWSIRADPVQIEQILVNLVVNSRDAMPSGGTLTITTSQASFDEAYIRDGHRDAAVGDYAVLSVSDSGMGMDSATKARVFEPFFTTKGQGTGLGLATVYGIVKQSGGSIWLYSEPGRGTTVKIFLPRFDQPELPATRQEPAAHIEGRPATILLVEDDELVRVATLKTLRRGGHKVLEAVDGEAALSVIAREAGQIDLVITDLVMPRLGGRELGQRLRAKGNEAAILYMSGYTGDAVTQRAMLDEGADFLEKPFTSDQLLRKVDEILRNSHPATLRHR